MDFDSLENILSNSSNDSFFGELGKNAAKNTSFVAKSSAGHKSAATNKSKLSTSFSSGKGAENSDIMTGSPNKTSHKAPVVSTKSVYGASTVESESELMAILGFDPKKPKTGKVNINNLFGEVETENFSRQTTETTASTTGTYNKSQLRPKVSKKQFLSSYSDPLGFFSPKEKQKPNVQGKDYKEIPNLAAKCIDEGITLSTTDKQAKEASFFVTNVEDDASNLDQTLLSKTGLLESFGCTSIELQNSLQGIRLEEARLLLAAQKKMQEQLLLEMRKKQETVFLHQEVQFNSMLKNQALRKNDLENAIRMQEERIRSQAENLISLPILDYSQSDSFFANEGIMPYVDVVHFKEVLSKLKEENQRLENIISNISGNHRKEIELMKESHKNHITLFEKIFHELQVQSKNDGKKTELSVQDRRFSESENPKLIENYDRKLRHIEEQHDSSIINLRKYYDAEIGLLKKDNKRTIENILNQFKSLEPVVKLNNQSLQVLDAAIINLTELIKDIRNVLNEIVSATGKDLNEEEEKLIAREKQIEGREHRLQLLEDTSPEDDRKLLDLVLSLEALLRNFTECNAKERLNLTQKVDLLHDENLSFNRERAFFRELVEKMENRIQESQKLQEAEKKFYLRQVQEERRLLNKERGKLGPKMQSDVENPEFYLHGSSKDSTDSKIRINKGMKQNVFEAESCADEREVQYWERIKNEFLKGIQDLKVMERQVHESLQRTKLTEKRFNYSIQTLKEQIRLITIHEARLSKRKFELAQGHFQLQSTSRKEDYNVCRFCKTVIGNHPCNLHENFESKLEESFFNVHETTDCYVANYCIK